MPTPAALEPAEAASRVGDYTVIDVRTPGEYASGHLPGAHNIPLDQLSSAVPALQQVAVRHELLVVCASGARSDRASTALAEQGISATTLVGGTRAWAEQGHLLDHSDHARAIWPMERQVRLTAGALILGGLVLALLIHPAFQLISAAIAAGLVFSALTDTCGMAAVLAKLPYNRTQPSGLRATLNALTR